MKKILFFLLKFICILYGSCFYFGCLYGLISCFKEGTKRLPLNIVLIFILFSLGTLLFYIAFKKITISTNNTESIPHGNTGYANENKIPTPNANHSIEPNRDTLISPQESIEQLRTAQMMLSSTMNQLNESRTPIVTVQSSSAPNEILNSMRSSYSPIQAQNDIRILNDSISLIQTTSNLETFFSRYELAMQKIQTLEQAKRSGMNINIPITSSYLISLKNHADNVLQATYNNELRKINDLKTSNGKQNRIDKFIDFLSEYKDEFEFSDTYKNILSDLNSLKKEL